MKQEPTTAAAFRIGLIMGVKKGWRGFLWMIQIVLPVSLLTTLIDWTGWLRQADFLIAPVMKFLGLPAAAALPLVIGMAANIYGGIAAMIVLPLNNGQMTLIGIFLLMAHNLIQEGIVQGRSGINPWKATLFRIGAAAVTVMIAAYWLAPGTLAAAPAPAGAAIRPALDAVLGKWLAVTGFLCLKIFCIIMSLMTLLEVMKFLDWIGYVVKVFAPLLRLMGLGEKVGLLWVTAIVFGLAYGGAVIVEEARVGHISPEDLELLHLSIGVNHSMVEDPPLFISLGLNAFWLYVPRLVVAIIAVHLIQLWRRFAR